MYLNFISFIKWKGINVLFLIFCGFLTVYSQQEIKKLSIKDAISIGLQNNPTIKSAKENISANNGRFWSGISLPQPEVEISYEYVPTGKNLNNFGEKTVTINQSFEFPSNYFIKASRLNKEENIALINLRLAERNAIAEIKTAYFKVLAKNKQIKLAEQNLKISEDLYKKAEINHNVGEGTNLEKLTAKVHYSEAINNLFNIKNELKSALAELDFALGYSIRKEKINYELTDSLFFSDYKLNQEELFNLLEANNTSINIAKLNSDISSIDKSLAWSSLLPNFNLSYFKQTRDGDSRFYGASFGVSVPLWFMFENKGKIQEAYANQSISESDLASTTNSKVLQLKNIFSDYENALQQVKLFTNDILPEAEEIYRTASKSYNEGELTFLELLHANQTLINSNYNYINVLFNYYQSLFSIEELTGQNITD